MRPNRFLSLCYIRRSLAPIYVKIITVSKKGRNELLLEPRPLGVSSGASKMISESVVCLAETVHLSCTDTNTISKWAGTRLHMTHVT
jgi:hypothetical protein